MPIYAYKCSSCQHCQDVLQKISDAPLTVCPQCGAATFTKQLTAAGFQLKGSGWYATDFRNGSGAKDSKGAAKPADTGESAAEGKPAAAGETKPESKPETKSDGKSADAGGGAGAPAQPNAANS